MPEALTKDLFAQHMGDRFRVRTDSSDTTELELHEVTARNAEAPRPFSILFRGPMNPILPQRTYRLEHDRLEPIDLFLVPVGPDTDRAFMLYEAVFN